MLTRLAARHFAVLEEVELEFGAGFTALTGETGAGKSMLVDALAMALGARADSSAVRSGESKAEVSASFSVPADSAARRWLADHDLDEGTDCELRRVVTAEGRSRGYINNRPATMELLRELGELLVDICGQHEHQSLVRKASQRELLDAFGGHAASLLESADAWSCWREVSAELETLQRAGRDRDDRRDLLRYQARELKALGLAEGEIESLENERQVLANVGRIAAGVTTALEALYDADEVSAQATVSATSRIVGALAEIDVDLVGPAAEIEEAAIHLREAADQLRRRLSTLEHDPLRLQAVENRLAAVETLARKHRCEVGRLWLVAGELDGELAALDGSQDRIESLAAAAAQLRSRLDSAQSALHKARVKAGRALATAVNGHLRKLGLPDAALGVSVTHSTSLEASGPQGADEIEFLVSTNAGQTPGPVARVASGGELSRISLALRLASLAPGGPTTLIFDEVDAGTGGAVAEIVGQSLQRLASARQVLCVTHLPQVASLSDHHCLVEKTAGSGSSKTGVRTLDRTGRVEEIARMLGGVKITERARAHAREMLSQSTSRRAG
ncbi:MAG: DNA repair protein RecN [Gammaproteobacteria bacterium]|nr:DNA repair protein RecN [Gammaproteobacteria bacterium]